MNPGSVHVKTMGAADGSGMAASKSVFVAALGRKPVRAVLDPAGPAL